MLAGVEAGGKGKVTLKVQVKDEAREAGSISNTAKVKVGENPEITTNTITNPVPRKTGPEKILTYVNKDKAELKETVKGGAGDGTSTLHIYQMAKPGDEITYAISISNYRGHNASVVIRDAIDKNVEVVEASDANIGTTVSKPKAGVSGADVIWEISDIPLVETAVTVTLTVKVLEEAKKAGKIDNQAFVKIGVDEDGDGKIDFDDEVPTSQEENPVEPDTPEPDTPEPDKPVPDTPVPDKPEEPVEEHQIVIRKTFEGVSMREEDLRKITFTVTDAKTGDKVGTYTLGKDFKKDSKGVYTASVKVPAGTYKVVESANTVSGLKCSVSYKAESRTASDKAEIDLTGETSKTVEITNTYAKITVTPTVTNPPADSGRKITPGGSTTRYTPGGNVLHTDTSDLKGAPKTGDDNNIVLYLVLLAAAAILCSGMVIVRKKKKKS